MPVISPARPATVATHDGLSFMLISCPESPAYMSAVYAQLLLPEMISTAVHNLHCCEQPTVEGL